MKRIGQIATAFCLLGLALASGCSTTQKADPQSPASAPSLAANSKSDSTALQGTWKGKEIGGQIEGDCYLIIKGNELEYRGADPGEWYKGTFTLREDTNPKQLIGAVLECPAPKFIGKTCQAIYRIEEGKLTITGNEPGNPEVPYAFDAADSRRFVLEKE
jgi:uncharacterized protein (TIGR03067 family)